MPGKPPLEQSHAEDDAAQPLEHLEQIQGSAAGSTVQLGADFLAYVRQRFSPVEFKHELVERLLPTVPRRGKLRPVEEGKAFGKFTIVEQLGKGGMAVVYRATDPERASGSGDGARGQRDKQVALKVMREDISLDPEYVRRFLREAANAALIDHPNVVAVFEVGSVGGRLYFTMELIEGETLKDTLARGALDEERGIQVLCQLVDGLIAAHDRGIGHRDLKPSNIMLVSSRTRFGVDLKDEFDIVVKVTDFGLAHMLDADTTEAIPEGKFLGTAKYVAPEVIRGQQATLKSDLFSLGVLAFQMFSGRAPFNARTKMEFITANLSATAPLLDSVTKVSHDLALLVNAMLEKDPARRPDAPALRRDLARLVARRAGGAPIRVDDDPSSAFHTGLAAAPRPPAGPPPAALVGAGAASIIIVLGLVLLLRGDGGPDRVEPPTAVTIAAPTAPTESPTPEPTGVRGDASLEWVPLPPSAAFVDAMAHLEFGRSIERGDAAWVAGRPLEALAQWEKAERLAPTELAPLRARVRMARRDAALARAADAERRDNPAQAVMELETATSFGAGGPDVERRLARARALRDLRARLTEARALRASDPAAAVRLLEELLPIAESLGPPSVDEVKNALARARGEPAQPTTTAPPPATEAAPQESAEARRLLDQAERYLVEQSLDAAEQSIATARRAGATGARVDQLLRRLSRARLTPSGFVFVEVPGLDEPATVYARPQRVTGREFADWFGPASARAGLNPPRPWHGASRPPAGTEDDPVTGVEVEQARAFAAARGERLPTDEELAAMRARLGLDAAHGVVTAGRFEAGFFTVRDPGGR